MKLNLTAQTFGDFVGQVQAAAPYVKSVFRDAKSFVAVSQEGKHGRITGEGEDRGKFDQFFHLCACLDAERNEVPFEGTINVPDLADFVAPAAL